MVFAVTFGRLRERITRFPANSAQGISPDTHLVLTFPTAPTLGTSGQIRIYDAANNRLVDTLDLSIPAAPTTGVTGPPAPYTPTLYESTKAHPTNADTVPGTPSGAAMPTSRDYQLTIIGGFSDGFHFYPVIVHDRVATIYPHHNLLRYNSDAHRLCTSLVLWRSNATNEPRAIRSGARRLHHM